MNIFVFIFLSTSRRPIGSHPDTWKLYKSNINKTTGTFTCFDNSKIINLSQINDNHVDCDDGSDEPGTPAYEKGTFYCRNEGDEPKEIPKSSVGDGVCDCCDGTDEIYNTDVTCPITCGKVKFTREQLIDILTYKYKKGIDRKKYLAEWGAKFYEERVRYKNFYKKALGIYDKFLAHILKKYSDNPVNITQANNQSEINVQQINKKQTESKKESEFSRNMKLFRIVEENHKENKKNPFFINFLYKIHQYTFHPQNSNLAFRPIFKKAFVDDMVDARNLLLDPYNANKEVLEIAHQGGNATIALTGELTFKDDYAVEFMGEVRLDEMPIAYYKKRIGDVLIYEGEKCPNSDKNVTFKLRLICYSGSKLVRAIQLNECEHDAYLGTPVVCNYDKIAELKEFDFKELKKLYRLLEIKKTKVDKDL